MKSLKKSIRKSQVVGGGQYQAGEYARLLAIPGDHQVFIGWYENGELVSNEGEYRFRVSESRNITAKYIDSLSDFTMNHKEEFNISSISRDYHVSFASSNTKVITISEDGSVITHKRGKAEINRIITGPNGFRYEDSATVTVKHKWWQWLIIVLLFGWIWY